MFFRILEILLCLVFLVFPAIQIIRARKNSVLRTKIEDRIRGWILDPGQGLFDKNADYTWIIQWYQWAAIPAAILIVIPGYLLWELGAATAFGLLLWIGLKIYFWFDSGKANEVQQTE